MGAWDAVKTQLKDIHLLAKLQVVAEFTVEDPVNPDSFKLATQYATLFPESLNIELNAKNSQASARVAEFNHTVIKFQ